MLESKSPARSVFITCVLRLGAKAAVAAVISTGLACGANQPNLASKSFELQQHKYSMMHCLVG